MLLVTTLHRVVPHLNTRNRSFRYKVVSLQSHFATSRFPHRYIKIVSQQSLTASVWKYTKTELIYVNETKSRGVLHTCHYSQSIIFSVTPYSYKLLSQVMSYISVIIHKQSDWLVQRQSDKLFNLQKTQTVNLCQRFKRDPLTWFSSNATYTCAYTTKNTSKSLMWDNCGKLVTLFVKCQRYVYTRGAIHCTVIVR